jgi:hypothetical protein
MLVGGHSTTQLGAHKTKKSALWNFETRTLDLGEGYATVCLQKRMGSPGVQVPIIYDPYPKVEEVFERLSPGGIPSSWWVLFQHNPSCV